MITVRIGKSNRENTVAVCEILNAPLTAMTCGVFRHPAGRINRSSSGNRKILFLLIKILLEGEFVCQPHSPFYSNPVLIT